MSWRRKWQPIPVFLPGKSSGQRNLAGYSPWGHKRVRHNLATSFVDNVLIWYTYYCNIIIPKHSLTSPLCCTTIILFMVRTFNNNSCGNSQVSNTVLSTLVTMVHSRFPELIHFLTGEVYTYFFFFFFWYWPQNVACGITISWPGIEPESGQWKFGILTTGLPRNSQEPANKPILPHIPSPGNRRSILKFQHHSFDKDLTVAEDFITSKLNGPISS